ncbi:hypothetical protein ACFQZF_00710 [Flavobacterium myungsuense]|uniref:Protein kinase domain-containing protein n=1 Tax=Flavobacterium myungsuense TaxID=651823 RepID=A0ABW3IZN1_9FLAO
MQFDDFFSEGLFINLPFHNPRVSLNVSSSSIVKQSFKLYNPFSLKAQILKKVVFFAVVNIPYFRETLSRKFDSGSFIIHLEKTLKTQIHASLYYPTIAGKMVLQLLTTDGKVLGYSKIGLSHSGKLKIENELKAIKELANISDVFEEEYLIMHGDYVNYNYIIVKKIKGTNKPISDEDLLKKLRKFDREKKFILQEHPRFIALMNTTKNLEFFHLQEVLIKISNSSKELYSLSYEHGDMAPWNIFINKKNKISFFDFEYFVKDGLQHLDFINYHYQIAVNLKSLKSPLRIVEYVKDKIQINEFSQVFSLFLINKILVNTIDKENSERENKLLEFITKSI